VAVFFYVKEALCLTPITVFTSLAGTVADLVLPWSWSTSSTGCVKS